MGLDSHVYSVPLESVINDFDFHDRHGSQELFYWRKHHDMHQFMKRLFISKGGDMKNGFNCENIRITLDDILLLEQDMDWYDEEPSAFKRDLKFISEAKIALADNKALYFTSWY